MKSHWLFLVLFLSLAFRSSSFLSSSRCTAGPCISKTACATTLEMAKGPRKKRGKLQTSEGIKLGKGFGDGPPPSEEKYDEKGEWKDDWSTTTDTSATSSSSSSSYSMEESSNGGELIDEAAVFEKYGIGKSKKDRFGNEISAR